MNIYYLFDKIKVAIIILAVLLVFGLARLVKLSNDKTPIRIDNIPTVQQNVNGVKAKSAQNFVASKNGTRYYLPSCSGVKRIKEENKIYFATREEAEQSGLLPAANCF